MRNFFVKDTAVIITDDVGTLRQQDRYNYVFEKGANVNAAFSKLRGHVLTKARVQEIQRLLRLPRRRGVKGLETLTLVVKDYEAAKRYIKQNFPIIKAAGGIVTKGDQVLMIYRLGRWDLPKGKLNSTEYYPNAALREVEEECSVKVALGGKIGYTWYSYLVNGQLVFKKIAWYQMNCIDDTAMQPQQSEGIEKVGWISQRDLPNVLTNAYFSTRYILAQYAKQKLNNTSIDIKDYGRT